ncbi:hypothetical protein GYH30_056671 [Glycine max]|nr:hypothetical protein GYH30_056671 [Glycine max]
MCHVRYSLYQQYHDAKVRQGIFYCVKARRHGFFRDYGLCDMTMLRFEPDKASGIQGIHAVRWNTIIFLLFGYCPEPIFGCRLH